MSNTTVKISKTAQKYLSIIALGTIRESEIISMKSFMGKDKENAQIIFSAISDKQLELNPEQQKKGIYFLIDQWKTSRGIERKNNPFGYREQEVLDNYTDIVLSGFYNAGNAYVDYYLPLYLVSSKDNSFEYYYNGKIQIVG